MAKQVKEFKPFIAISVNQDEQVILDFTPRIDFNTKTIGKSLGWAALNMAELVRELTEGDRVRFEEALEEILTVFAATIIANRNKSITAIPVDRKDEVSINPRFNPTSLY